MKIFLEEQRFAQLWLHIVLIVSFMIPLIMITIELLQVNGKNNEAQVSLFVLVGAFIFIYGIILSMKLTFRIDENGIYYRFIPFHFSDRFLPWNEISKAYVRKYNAIYEYGGWGLRMGFFRKRGSAINVSGNMGLQLELKNGKKLLIGTQKEAEVERVLKTYQSKVDHEV
jgi:hypothetical protein